MINILITNRKNKLIKNWAVVLLTTIVSAIVVTSAGAALNFFEPQSLYKSEAAKIVDTSFEATGTAKARAPEPSTMALFGSGIIGMMISFIRRTYYIAKRAMDIVGSVIAIILLSPLMLLTALLIKLTSRGPIFFTQIRVGKDGEIFNIYKFRTMCVDAEKETGAVWATQNDNRLIPIGKFLRKAHIDEIPQFINVLRGEMSIIGPRPERPIFVEKFKKEICDYEKRLEIKPGITGLAQVWHKYDETIADVRKKIKYDVLYIKKVCLWTDLRIVLRTVRVVFTGEGAR